MSSVLPLEEYFADLPDPRREHARRHCLIDVLVITLCAVLSGAEGFVDIAAFGQAREGWLRDRLGLSLAGGIPSHDTFGRVFARLDPGAFSACFLSWTQALHEATQGQIIALDGKTLRSSLDAATGKAALHLVSAWAEVSGLALGQMAVDGKSNEITALPALLSLLDLSGSTVTIDAMGCQTGIAERVIEGGGDYALALKGNHKTLYEDTARFFGQWEATDGVNAGPDARLSAWGEGPEKDHGRIEVRHYRLAAALPGQVHWLDPQQRWAGLRGVGRAECERRVGGQVTRQARYFLTSLTDAEAFGRAVRGHWGIENRLHWVLDVAMGEDACRVRKDHAPQNLATLRHIVLNLLRQEKTDRTGIKARRLRAAWDTEYLLRVLTGPEK